MKKVISSILSIVNGQLLIVLVLFLASCYLLLVTPPAFAQACTDSDSSNLPGNPGPCTDMNGSFLDFCEGGGLRQYECRVVAPGLSLCIVPATVTPCGSGQTCVNGACVASAPPPSTCPNPACGPWDISSVSYCDPNLAAAAFCSASGVCNVFPDFPESFICPACPSWNPSAYGSPSCAPWAPAPAPTPAPTPTPTPTPTPQAGTCNPPCAPVGETCSNGTCVTIVGLPFGSCARNADCTTAPYNTCVAGICKQDCGSGVTCPSPTICGPDPDLSNPLPICLSAAGGGGGSTGGAGSLAAASISLPPASGTITDPTGLPAQIVTKFLPAVIIILGFLTLFYIIFAGIRFIISRGDPEKVAEAKSRLTYAIVGFIILLLAFAATQLIDRLFLNSGAI